MLGRETATLHRVPIGYWKFETVLALALDQQMENVPIFSEIIRKSCNFLETLDAEAFQLDTKTWPAFVALFPENRTLPALKTLILPEIGVIDGERSEKKQFAKDLIAFVMQKCPNLTELRTGGSIADYGCDFDPSPLSKLKILEVSREFRAGPELRDLMERLDLFMVLENISWVIEPPTDTADEDPDMDEFDAYWWTAWNYPLMAHQYLENFVVYNDENPLLGKVRIRKDELITPMQLFHTPFSKDLRGTMPMQHYLDERVQKDFNPNPQRCIAFSLAGHPTRQTHMFFALLDDVGVEPPPPEDLLPVEFLLEKVPLHQVVTEFVRIACPKRFFCSLMHETLSRYSPEFSREADAIVVNCNAILALGLAWGKWHTLKMPSSISRLYETKEAWWRDLDPAYRRASYSMTDPDSRVNLLMLYCAQTYPPPREVHKIGFQDTVEFWLLQNREQLELDINARDSAGRTALQYALAAALIQPRAELIALLRDCGAVE